MNLEPNNESHDIDLNNLGLMDDGDPEVNVDSLPKERSGVPRELPQPGTLRLRIPGGLPVNNNEVFKPMSTQAGQRLQIAFRDAFPLQDTRSGQAVNYTMSTMEQAIWKDGVAAGHTNEAARALKALGHSGALNSKADYIKGFKAAEGKEFLVDAGYNTRCNPNKPIYKDKARQPQMGCGQNYDMQAKSYESKTKGHVEILPIPRDATGAYKQRFACKCGAELSVWLRFSNYRPAKG